MARKISTKVNHTGQGMASFHAVVCSVILLLPLTKAGHMYICGYWFNSMIVTDLYKNIFSILDHNLLNKWNSWLIQWLWNMQIENPSSKYFTVCTGLLTLAGQQWMITEVWLVMLLVTYMYLVTVYSYMWCLFGNRDWRTLQLLHRILWLNLDDLWFFFFYSDMENILLFFNASLLLLHFVIENHELWLHNSVNSTTDFSWIGGMENPVFPQLEWMTKLPYSICKNQLCSMCYAVTH